MKTLIIYTSQTGFTKRYAEWIANSLHADTMKLDEAKKQADDYFASYDAILYGGWTMGGTVVDVKWFLERAKNWREKKLAIFCVGASPAINPDVEVCLHNIVNDEQREYIKTFYCQGGLCYEKMRMPSKLMMKAFASMIRKKKDATESDKKMAEMLAHSYDISDEKYAEPIIEYIRN